MIQNFAFSWIIFDRDISADETVDKLESLLINLRENDEAEKLFRIDDPSNTQHDQLAYLYQRMGMIRMEQAKYEQAIDYSERALSIWQQILLLNDSRIAVSYNHIAMGYDYMEEYSKALAYYTDSNYINFIKLFLNFS